jgi:hypothetical protein
LQNIINSQIPGFIDATLIITDVVPVLDSIHRYGTNT